MEARSRISYQWQQSDAALPYTTGVSLHSHTSLSVESLSFIHAMCADTPMVRALVAHYERRALRNQGVTLDFNAGHWRPPLVPRMAFDLERKQIQQLGLDAFVSITDHDCIQAPLLLRTIPVARRIPVSVEWTVPFRATAFHLGVHNLPSAGAHEWMRRFEAFTAEPNEVEMRSIFEELNALPHVLLILNHPIWDLYKIGDKQHIDALDQFLQQNNNLIHALELNGLRHARENRQVLSLADRWHQVVISGGDRHGLEANANINLTNAKNFNEFVTEIRVERRSHVLFMQQYAQPWEQRILDSTLDAITDHAHFSPGWKRWDERAFHPDRAGVMRPLSEFWPGGRPPLALYLALHAMRCLRYRSLARLLAIIFSRFNGSIADQDTARELA